MRPTKLLVAISCFFLIGSIVSCTRTSNETNECVLDPEITPSVVSPDGDLVSGLRPTFNWTFPGDCEPDGFHIEIITPQIFDDEPPQGDPHDVVYDYPVIIGEVAGSETHWTPDADLETATTYRWRVAAMDGNTWGNFSTSRTFWTGPTCDATQIWAPTLVSPAHASVVSLPSADLIWEWPDASCLPDGYFYEISTSNNYETTVRAAPLPPNEGYVQHAPYLDDCGLYYWRVKAFVGDSGGNWSSSYFFTDFDGTCEQFSCDLDQLVSPVQNAPAGGEVVTDLTGDFRFKWEYQDPACHPDGYYFEVYSGPDFDSTPLGSGFALDTRMAYGPIPEIPSYVSLPDCTDYTWRVAALEGDAVGPFSEETFHTDLYDECTDVSAASSTQLAGIACLDNERMMVSFRFPTAPSETYQATVDQVLYECQTIPEAPSNLFCTGPISTENARINVKLHVTATKEMLFDGMVSSPSCTSPPTSGGNRCVPPPEGCVAAHGGDTCWVWFEEACSCACFN